MFDCLWLLSSTCYAKGCGRQDGRFFETAILEVAANLDNIGEFVGKIAQFCKVRNKNSTYVAFLVLFIYSYQMERYKP
jgi:hypothetical protein